MVLFIQNTANLDYHPPYIQVMSEKTLAEDKKKPKKPKYWNVPPWAPKSGKICELSKPLLRWFKELMTECKSLISDEKGHSLKIEDVQSDAELNHICILVNELRLVNRNLCNGVIKIDNDTCYEPSRDMQSLMKKINQLKKIRTSVVQGNANEIGSSSKQNYIAIWKRDMRITKNKRMIVNLTNRLSSFVHKQDKIDFNSPALVLYTESLSPIRIEVDMMCCGFLEYFVPM